MNSRPSFEKDLVHSLMIRSWGTLISCLPVNGEGGLRDSRCGYPCGQGNRSTLTDMFDLLGSCKAPTAFCPPSHQPIPGFSKSKAGDLGRKNEPFDPNQGSFWRFDWLLGNGHTRPESDFRHV